MKRRPLLLLVLALVLAVSLTGQAYGHALPVRSDPAPNASLAASPSQVTIWFSEQLNSQSSSMKVLDNSGNQVDNKNVQFSNDHLSMWVGLPSLGKGVYTVSWTSISAVDGHLASGSFPFGIGEVVPPPPSTQPGLQPSLASLVPEGVARWAYYLGQTILVGGPLFFLLVLTPIMRRRLVASTQTQSTVITPTNVQPSLISDSSIRRLLIVSLIGAAVTVAGVVGLVFLELNSSQSSPASFLNSQLGQLYIAKLVLVGVSAVTASLGLLRAQNRGPWVTSSVLSGLVLLLTTSLSGHNSVVAGAFAPISILADWAHLVGVSVWIGGLVQFASIIPVLKREGSLNQGVVRIVPRFSRVAITSVGIIAISGLYSALYQVSSFSALFGTEYGQTLLVKMGLTAVLILLGGLNQLVWYPRILTALRAVGQALPSVGRLVQRLARSVRTEVVIAIILILVVGLLTALPTAFQVNQTQNRPTLQATTFAQTSNGVNVALAVYPFHVGANSFQVSATGSGLTNIQEILLEFNYKDNPPIPPAPANTTTPTNGQWVIEGQYLSRAGNWDIKTTVVFTNTETVVDFNINLPQYPGLDTAKVFQIPYPDTNFNGWGVLVDGQGNVWFSVPTAGTTTASIGRYSPSSASFQMLPPRYPTPSPGPIAFDSKGKIWYENQLPIGTNTTLYGSIGSLDPATGTFSPAIVLPYSNGNWQGGGLAIDSHDNIWITDSSLSRLLEYNQTSQSWATLNQTSPFHDYLNTPQASSDLNAITVDQNTGNVWFVGDAIPLPNAPQSGHGGGGIGKIEMYNQTSRKIRNFVPQSPNSTLLEDVTVGPNGDVWFGEHGSNRIGKISVPYGNGTITQISLDPVNPGAFPWGLKFDSQGNLWFSEHVANQIGFYNLATSQFQEFPIPIAAGNPADAKFIALDQYGNVWFAEGQGGNLGVLALLPQAIGLGGQTSDFYYELISGALMVAFGISALRWNGILRFFSRRGGPAGQPAKTATTKQRPQAKKKNR